MHLKLEFDSGVCPTCFEFVREGFKKQKFSGIFCQRVSQSVSNFLQYKAAASQLKIKKSKQKIKNINEKSIINNATKNYKKIIDLGPEKG